MKNFKLQSSNSIPHGGTNSKLQLPGGRARGPFGVWSWSRLAGWSLGFGVWSFIASPLGLDAADAPQRPPITGVSHIALFVHDVDKSRAFYKDFLGFDEPFSLTNKDGSLHLTWININD